MHCKSKKRKCRDVMTVIGILALLAFIFRMWPILLLMVIGMFSCAMWLIGHIEEESEPAEQVPALNPPVPASEESVLNDAFAVLQRRITEQVRTKHPEARWVWAVSDARDRFSKGGELCILLNRAGGYQKAKVQVNNLLFCGLQYPSTDQSLQPAPAPEPEQPKESVPETETVDYGLLAFEWVEANLQALNGQCNEVIGRGEDSFRIPASKLPHGDSWPLICKELLRNGFSIAEPLADGIQVQIKVK